MPATTLADEVKLAGRYAYVRELGRGATGRVMLVADTAEGGARRAAKVVPAAEAERLAWELDALARVSHPGLAKVFELLRLDAPLGGAFALDAGAALLIEEHVAGKPASEALEGLRGADDAERAARVCAIGEWVASALAALHAAGLVHGDVKPANVLVPLRAAPGAGDAVPAARLIDLGLARPPGTSETVSGTPAYLAPEAWLGVRSVATDLFALGVTLRQLLGLGATDVELPSRVPPPLARVIAALTAADPGARPSSAREVVAQLAVAGARQAEGEPAGHALRAKDALFAREATGAERAMAMESLPFVGGERALPALVQALSSAGVVVVHGPRGAGRSRLVREAVRAVQRARVTAGLRAPTYSQARAVPTVAPAYDAIVHVVEDAPGALAQAASLVRAAGVDGTAVAVVLEVCAAPVAGEALRSIAVGPLSETEVRALLGAALSSLEGAPARASDAVVEGANRASGGLAGRLCRLLGTMLGRGADPARAATWRSLAQAGDELESGALTAAARSLAEALALAGGALEARVAAQLPGVADAALAARELMSAGLASVGADGRLLLRADSVRGLSAALPAGRRRALAEALLAAEPRDEVVRGLAEAARGAGDAGELLLLSAIGAARRRGQPEVAAEVVAHALSALGARPSLALAGADALRALGRYAEGLALLASETDAASRGLRAELARLTGDVDGARAEAERVMGDGEASPRVAAGALALVARLRLDAGDVEGAAADAERVARTTEPGAALARARAGEVLALVALSRGELGAAGEDIDAVLAAARAADERPAEARAVALLATLAHARGDVRVAAVEAGRAFELAEAAGEAHAAASFRVNVGLARLDLGELGPAIEALRDGARRLARLGRDSDAARAAYNLGNAAHLAGDDDLALVALGRAVEFAGRDASVVGLAGVVRSDIARRRGDLSGALAALDGTRASELPAATRAVVAARRAIAAGLGGDGAGAMAAIAEAERAAADADTVPARAECALARAALALAAGAGARAYEITKREHEVLRGASYELRLRAALLAADAATSVDDAAAATLLTAEARSLLDEAAATLPASARAALRGVLEHRRVLAATPAPTSTRSQRDVGGAEDLRWRRLAGLAKRLTAERTTTRLAGVVLDAALELSGAERALLLARESDGSLRVRAFRGLARRGESGESPGFSRSIASRVLDDATPLATVDAAADGRLDAAASVHALALRSVAAVPMRLGDDAAGVLYLDDRLRAGAFGPSDVALLVDLADLASLALANAESLRREHRSARRLERLRRQLAETVERQGLELVTLRRAENVEPLAGLVGGSESMRRVAELASRVAVSDVPVLVLGESGVGKELVARAVHDRSARKGRPFISENCGAIPEPLLESALFGHVRGAFTGADRPRQGLFEAADGGTLLLDEIGEMSPAMQTKLLRVLQDGEIRAVGGERTRKVDVRVLAATHRDLDAMVRSGAFRQDLYYRLAVMTISVPPLRERSEDVAPLVAHFVQKHARGRAVRVDRAALACLQGYAWPGNVRQLENEVQRALVMATDVIRPEHLSPVVLGTASVSGAAGESLDALDLRGQTDALEQRLIRRALAEHGTQTAAAKALGVSRFGLQKMCKRLGIVP
jgi:transcriptional regulator with GAF, ATPase, and Fis domain